MAKIKSKVSKKSKSPSSDWEILPIAQIGNQMGYSWSNSPSSSNTYQLQGSANNTGVNKQMSEAQLAQARKRAQQQKEAEYNERARRIQESIAAQNQPLSAEQLKTSSQSTGDKLSLAMNTPYGNPAMYPTLSGYVEGLDYINPLKFVGDLGAGLGSVPYNLQQGNYGQAALPVGQALLAGALAGVGAKGTGQFVNNLANPFAGMNFRKGNANKFTSEIDWGKWNPDTPKYPELINEYNAIEESTKKAGNWMKNPDGSPFQGTPEQFIQQQSSHFKKAFPEGFDQTTRGSSYFFNTQKLDEPLFTGDIRSAQHYTATENPGFWNINKHKIKQPTKTEYPLKPQSKEELELIREAGKTGDYSKVIQYKINNALNSNEGGLYQLYSPKSKNSFTIDAKGKEWTNVPYEGKEMPTDFIAEDLFNKNLDYINIENVRDPSLGNLKIINPNRINTKSAIGNVGFFDMTNPNIYKSVAPYIGLGGLGAAAMQEKKNGGSVSDWEIVDDKAQSGKIINDNMGQWKYPGEITRIEGNTMATHGYGDIPLYVVPNKGEPKLVLPNTGIHEFKGADSFTEYPLPEAGGGYRVIRSNERKGKTHKVIGPDGTVKFFGDSKLGQHPKDPARKKAFYARHKKNLAKNPYFRAFARKTWADGGELNDWEILDNAQIGKKISLNEFKPKFANSNENIQNEIKKQELLKSLPPQGIGKFSKGIINYIPPSVYDERLATKIAINKISPIEIFNVPKVKEEDIKNINTFEIDGITYETSLKGDRDAQLINQGFPQKYNTFSMNPDSSYRINKYDRQAILDMFRNKEKGLNDSMNRKEPFDKQIDSYGNTSYHKDNFREMLFSGSPLEKEQAVYDKYKAMILRDDMPLSNSKNKTIYHKDKNAYGIMGTFTAKDNPNEKNPFISIRDQIDYDIPFSQKPVISAFQKLFDKQFPQNRFEIRDTIYYNPKTNKVKTKKEEGGMLPDLAAMAFGGNLILEKYQGGGNVWEIIPEAADGIITLPPQELYSSPMTDSNQGIISEIKTRADVKKVQEEKAKKKEALDLEDKKIREREYNKLDVQSKYVESLNKKENEEKKKALNNIIFEYENADKNKVKDFQKMLISEGYNLGKYGADGKFGQFTKNALISKFQNDSLDTGLIDKYYKKFDEKNSKNVKEIQQKLFKEGYLKGNPSEEIDGKFGDKTKQALEKYNKVKDPNAFFFSNIPKKIEEEECAKGMCKVLEMNDIMTDALGVKYKDAWDIFENMNNKKNSTSVYNIYDDPKFKKVKNEEELVGLTKEIKQKNQTTPDMYKTGDVVGIFWPGSTHHAETLKSKTHNTHVGFVSSVENGVPMITHNVFGTIKTEPFTKLNTTWIQRPKQNVKFNQKYQPELKTRDNSEIIKNYEKRFNATISPERKKQLSTILNTVYTDSQNLPKLLNSDVDPEWLESAVVGITGVETGIGKDIDKSIQDKDFKNKAAYAVKGVKDEDVSLGISKTKFNTLDNFSKSYFDIKSVDDLGNDEKLLHATTYNLIKYYDTFKDYALKFPEMQLTEQDIRDMSILAHNRGDKKLLTLGRRDNNPNSERYYKDSEGLNFKEEVKKLRDITRRGAIQNDKSTTLWRFLPDVVTAPMDFSSETYVSKVKNYQKDLYNKSFKNGGSVSDWEILTDINEWEII